LQSVLDNAVLAYNVQTVVDDRRTENPTFSTESADFCLPPPAAIMGRFQPLVTGRNRP
jgi:hypothetical protein